MAVYRRQSATARRRGQALVLLLTAITAAACSNGPEVRSTFTSEQADTSIEAIAGDEHCDQESITFLEIDGHLYARDPENLIPVEWREAEYKQTVSIPSDAVKTGFSDDGTSIWRSADGFSLYVGTIERAEHWPAVLTGFGCD
jgi:hypothetical protein